MIEYFFVCEINILRRVFDFFRGSHLQLSRIFQQPSLPIEQPIRVRFFWLRWRSCIRWRRLSTRFRLNPKVIGFFGVCLKRFKRWLIEFQCIKLSWSICFKVFHFSFQVWQLFILIFPFSRWRQQLKQRLMRCNRCKLLRCFLSMCPKVRQLFRGLTRRVILLRRPIGRRHRRLGRIWLFPWCWRQFITCSLKLCWFQRMNLHRCRLWPKCLRLHRWRVRRLHSLLLFSWSIRLHFQLWPRLCSSALRQRSIIISWLLERWWFWSLMCCRHSKQLLSLSRLFEHLELIWIWIRFQMHIQQLKCCKFRRGWLILCWLHLWSLSKRSKWHQVVTCCSIWLQPRPWLLSKISSLSSRMGFLVLRLRKLTQPKVLQSISFYLWQFSILSHLIKQIHYKNGLIKYNINLEWFFIFFLISFFCFYLS